MVSCKLVEHLDRLDGHPARLYLNLQKFRDLKKIYEAVILRLGIRPKEIIEKADLGFLIEPKSEKLSKALRQHSENIMKQLSDYGKRTFSMLTDLRAIDEDEKGFLGHLIAQECNMRESEGRELAQGIAAEARELHNAFYSPINA